MQQRRPSWLQTGAIEDRKETDMPIALIVYLVGVLVANLVAAFVTRKSDETVSERGMLVVLTLLWPFLLVCGAGYLVFKYTSGFLGKAQAFLAGLMRKLAP